MKLYSVFDIKISSELSLAELPEVNGEPDVTLKVEKLDQLNRDHDGGLKFRGQIFNLLRFSVYKGQEIIIEIHDNSDPRLIKSAIYGPLFSILLRQRKFLILHGSCVVLRNKAIAFIGGSKTGKSTIAEAFLQRNYSIITDDVLAIHFNSSFPKVVTSIPRIKLWSDSAAAMGYTPSQLPRINRNCQKRFHQFKPINSSNYSLSSIYFLDRASEVNIKKLNFLDAFIQLLQHSRGTALNHPEYVKSHFNYCSSLLHYIPCYSLQRPFDYNMLPKVLEKVQAHEYHTQDDLLPASWIS